MPNDDAISRKKVIEILKYYLESNDKWYSDDIYREILMLPSIQERSNK